MKLEFSITIVKLWSVLLLSRSSTNRKLPFDLELNFETCMFESRKLEFLDLMKAPEPSVRFGIETFIGSKTGSVELVKF